jgi:cytochrome c-type biogenesis protein CcmH/NrfG
MDSADSGLFVSTMKSIPLRIIVVGISLLIVWFISACEPTRSESHREIERVPGAYTFSEGDTAYAHRYQDALEHMGKNEYCEAEAIYRELIEKEPDNSNGYIGLGSALTLQDRYEEALEAYADAMKISPDSVEALIGLGSASYMLADFQNASSYYAKALEQDGENSNAHWGLAITLVRMGQEGAALAHLEAVIELLPNSSLATEADKMIDEIRLSPE